MKTDLYLLLTLCVILLMSGCKNRTRGDGDILKSDIPVKEYNKISIACPSKDIHYIQSDSAPALSITTDRNIYEMLMIEQNGNEIIIKVKEAFQKRYLRPTQFTITLNTKTLEKVNLAGWAVFNIDKPYKTDHFEINMAGACTINFIDSAIIGHLTTSIAGSSTVNAKKLQVSTFNGRIAGSGTYKLGGTAEKVSFDIAGKGSIKAIDLKASDVSCQVAGFANIDVYATQKLNLQIAGFGKVKYKGNPNLNKQGFALTRKVD